MPRELPYSRATDVEEDYLNVTDVKQYVFCPRVTYYTRVMRLKPIMGSQQAEAKKSHERVAELERRRQSLLKTKFPFEIEEKQFDSQVVSERLRTQGRLDMLAVTSEGENIPVEFKAMTSKNGQAHLDHKYQLAVLALLVEDANGTIVRRGIVHYLEDEVSVIVALPQGVKRRAENILRSIRMMMESGTVPPSRLQCARTRVGCGFADQCEKPP